MYKKVSIGLVLFFTLVFLFSGLVYAQCSKVICVDSPTLGNILKSNDAIPIKLTVNKTKPPAFQYRLYLRCGTSPWNPQNIITIVPCDFYGRCPGTYWWQVPPVLTQQTCNIAADLLDTNFSRLGVDVSDSFVINPSDVSSDILSLTPVAANVAPSGSVSFTVSGGTPPYKVGTLLHNKIDFSVTTINGNNTVQTFSVPGTFSVENSLTSTCSDTEVVVGVQDKNGARAFSLYNIDCP
jgi:hypothetical protein